MTQDEALGLSKYQRITVRKAGHKQTRRALVLSTQQIGAYVLVGYALIRRGDWDTISPHDHVAVVGQDTVTIA